MLLKRLRNYMSSKENKKNVLIWILWITIFVNFIHIVIVEYKNYKLEDKVDFYETVIEDFGMSEFISYPELYYEDGYTEQVKTHNCMWAIDNAIECENKLYECGCEDNEE